MKISRRNAIRRTSDTLIYEVLSLNQTFADLLQGKKRDLRKNLSHLHRIASELGRRGVDRNAAKDLCKSAQMVAELLVEAGVIEQMPRKIRLRKMHGVNLEPFPIGTEIMGWEMNRPIFQERYFIYLDNGKIFTTSKVLEHREDYLRTYYSVYSLGVVEEFYMGKQIPNHVSAQ
jgi:hypothetical protein